jgi:Type II secretion system (T2SS), protein F
VSGSWGLVAAVLGGAACRLVLAPGPRRSLRRLAGLARPADHPSSAARAGAGTSRGGLSRPRGTVVLPGPVLLDLVAAVLNAGAPVTTALRVVGQAAFGQGDVRAGQELLRLADRHDLALAAVDGATPPWVAALDEALLLARESGAAVAPLLAATAEEERRRRAAAARAAAARLGVRVVLPTGLCLLPAFVLLAIVPLVLALLGVQ